MHILPIARNYQIAIQKGCINLHCHQKYVPISVHHHHLTFYKKQDLTVLISISL